MDTRNHLLFYFFAVFWVEISVQYRYFTLVDRSKYQITDEKTIPS